MTVTRQDIERLAVAQGVYKLAAQAVSTKDPSSLRSEVDEYFAEQYRATGGKSYDLMLGAMKVGTYSLRFSKECDRSALVIEDYAALLAWAVENNFVKIDEKAVIQHCQATGELPDGATISTVHDMGGEIIGGLLYVEPERVNAALGGDSIIGLLEGVE